MKCNALIIMSCAALILQKGRIRRKTAIHAHTFIGFYCLHKVNHRYFRFHIKTKLHSSGCGNRQMIEYTLHIQEPLLTKYVCLSIFVVFYILIKTLHFHLTNQANLFDKVTK